MTFGAGFLTRPLGAIMLGAYTDKHGRRAGLLLTLGLMSIGIFSIACTPSYATVGWLAPMFVLMARLPQGFSAGMELGGVSVYLSEIATPSHKGFYVSWQSGNQQIAVMFAALVGVVLNAILPAEDDRLGLTRALAHGLRNRSTSVCAPAISSTNPGVRLA
jgi:MFS transporter, MHS family, citrate/tricarballylate:H+ symporter